MLVIYQHGEALGEAHSAQLLICVTKSNGVRKAASTSAFKKLYNISVVLSIVLNGINVIHVSPLSMSESNVHQLC